MPIYKSEGKKNGLQRYLVKVSYRDDSGKHDLTRVAYGRSEALLLEHELMGIKKEPSHITVEEFYHQYIQIKSSEVRETTLEKMEGILKRHILPYLGKERLDKLSPKKLEMWKIALNSTDLCVNSKNNAYRELRGFLNYAVKLDLMKESPLKKVDRFKDPYEVPRQGRLQYYTPAEFLIYQEYARKRIRTPVDHGFYIFFVIAYYTGMRKGEINALTWKDIEGDVIKVHKSVNVKGKEPRITPPKNKTSFRDIQIPEPLKLELKIHYRFQQEFAGFSNNWKVCGGTDYLADTSIDKFNRDVAAAAGLHRIRVHDFRHSHASLLANAGINIQEVARRLGHANVTETWQTYSHLYPQEEERALKVLNSVPTFYRQNSDLLDFGIVTKEQKTG